MTPSAVRAALRDVGVLTWRNLVHIAREPLRLSDATVQPVLFTLLVHLRARVRGRAARWRHLHGVRNRRLAGDEPRDLGDRDRGPGTGVIDRLRTLSLWKPAILVAARSPIC